MRILMKLWTIRELLYQNDSPINCLNVCFYMENLRSSSNLLEAFGVIKPSFLFVSTIFGSKADVLNENSLNSSRNVVAFKIIEQMPKRSMFFSLAVKSGTHPHYLLHSKTIPDLTLNRHSRPEEMSIFNNQKMQINERWVEFHMTNLSQFALIPAWWMRIKSILFAWWKMNSLLYISDTFLWKVRR